MSTRAYKLIEIKTEKTPTFNASEHYNVYNAGYETDNNDIIGYNRDEVEDILNDKTNEADYSKEELKIFKQILKDMEDEDIVEYYCF